jgi:subtilase family serine protease
VRVVVVITAAAGLALPAAACSTSKATTAGAAAASAPDCLTKTPPTCYTPRVFLTAYGIQPLLDRGIDGRGVTVVLPEEAETGPARPSSDVTDIRQDVADFDSRFGLPPARIQVITTLAGSSASPQQFCAGEDPFTSAEVATMNSALEYAAARHVTVVAASGDYGAAGDYRIGHGSCPPVKQVNLPASDPLVLAAGGTNLTANPVTGAYISETAWNTTITAKGGPPVKAAGGGFSRLFARPAYQDGVPGIGATRGVPDVAGDASPAGMALARSASGGGYKLSPGGGTSAAAPLWAGLIALADCEAGHPLGVVNPALYQIARGPLYHKAFHDITTGNNTVVTLTRPPVTITGHQAGPGWDPVTGWGTPDAQVLVPLLAR